MAIDRDEKTSKESGFEYMEGLSRAYEEAFRKRLEGKTHALEGEKRAALCRMQGEISRTAGRIAILSSENEKKELARMVKESAEEILRLLDSEEIAFSADPTQTPPISALLSRTTLLANRCLNLIVRHRETDERLFFLITSELSALYAIAAIN